MLRAASLRRHLSDDQRALLAVEEKKYLAARGREEQKKKGKAAGAQGGRGKKKTPAAESAAGVSDRDRSQDARAQAAAHHHISEHKVKEAEYVARADPKLAEEVRSGTMTLKRARRQIRKEKEARERQQYEAQLQTQSQADDAPALIEVADCLEWFARQPEDIHLVFGSPPYVDCRLCLEDGQDLGIARNTREWVLWMADVYQAALRCCVGLVAFVVDGPTRDYSWSAAPALLMAELYHRGITLRDPAIFHRAGIPGSGGPDWLRSDTEYVVAATRGGRLPWSDPTACGHPPKWSPGGEISHRLTNGQRVNGKPHTKRRAATTEDQLYLPPEIANPGNVITCSVGGGNMGDALCHENEAPFPESLAEFFIRSYCPPGGTVCDPFSGSGTTAKVALALGRKFRGCDLRPSQVALTQRRIALVQPQLFPEV
jgi:hypothetical protein